MAWEQWRVLVSGDATGGWIVEVHDGVHSDVYFPNADDAAGAEAAARAEHTARFFSAATPQPSDADTEARIAAEVERRVKEQVVALQATVQAEVETAWARKNAPVAPRLTATGVLTDAGTQAP